MQQHMLQCTLSIYLMRVSHNCCFSHSWILVLPHRRRVYINVIIPTLLGTRTVCFRFYLFTYALILTAMTHNALCYYLLCTTTKGTRTDLYSWLMHSRLSKKSPLTLQFYNSQVKVEYPNSS